MMRQGCTISGRLLAIGTRCSMINRFEDNHKIKPVFIVFPTVYDTKYKSLLA